jgi:hypothetical protein
MKKTLLISLLTLITYLTNAQTKGMKPVEATVPTGTERRMALVVVNKDYTGLSKLLNPLNDLYSTSSTYDYFSALTFGVVLDIP